VAELLRVLEQTVRAHGGPVLLGVLDGDAVGIVSSVPNLKETSATVGLGAAASLGALEPSYATASRVLEVAKLFSMTGILQLADVSLRAAVVRETELGDLLMDRHLGMLHVEEGFADVVKETLRVFLANGMQIKRSAHQLDIHPNTLRYRLRRYEELTGADLTDTGALLELWWALERDRVVGGHPLLNPPTG
jgi:putative transposase